MDHPVELEISRDTTFKSITQMPDVFVVGTHGAYDEERKWKEEMYVYPVAAAMRRRKPPGPLLT